ncbi:MAG TPA: phosphodiester glycosidase family protein, partial [Aggregatilineales bacterium]|nr:phosphodiester glycosidase family protein [Aggregatilineales bacterium]
GEWHLMHEWVALLKNSFGNPLMVVNANFFTETGHAVGLVVSDGQVSGDSLQGFGGMFLVNGAEVRVRSLVQEPYYGESYEQVAQGFPMLIEPGGIAASTGDGFDDPSRRTIIAQDFAGNILVMTTPAGRLTLRNAQRWLLDSRLNISIAFGLDGGKSSGLYFGGVENETLYPSVEPIPVIISAHVR